MASPLDSGVFGQKYGPLKGWQWVAIVGGGGGIVWYILKARQAAQGASSGTGALSADAAGPPLGYGSLQTLIIQQGAGSTASKKPNVAKKPASKARTFQSSSYKFPKAGHIDPATGRPVGSYYPATITPAKRGQKAKLSTLGLSGSGTVKAPKTGAPIYARLGNVWKLITSNQQYKALPKGTRIGTLPQFAG